MLLWKHLRKYDMMDFDLLQKGIIAYSWAVAGILMICVSAIANFYQKKFGEKTFYYFYFIPIIILFISVTLNLLYGNTFLSGSAVLIGSTISFLMIFVLYRIMMGVK